MIKSCVSFFRKQMKAKGRTWHTGRGAYVMEYDCSVTELSDRVEAFIAKHADKVIVERDAQSVNVTIKPELTTVKYYRMLHFNPSNLWPLMVWMAWE